MLDFILKITLSANDVLFIYTDGLLTFGDEKQIDHREVAQYVFQSRGLKEKLEPSDDYTALCLKI